MAGAGAAGGPSACPLSTRFWCDGSLAIDSLTGLQWERDFHQSDHEDCAGAFGPSFRRPTVSEWSAISGDQAPHWPDAHAFYYEPPAASVFVTGDAGVCWSASAGSVAPCVAMLDMYIRCVSP